jgi:hypothetical protein
MESLTVSSRNDARATYPGPMRTEAAGSRGGSDAIWADAVFMGPGLRFAKPG